MATVSSIEVVAPASSVGVVSEPSDASSVSWAAVFAGALAAAALSLILLLLGSGLGLSMVSPWSGQGVSGTTFAVSTAVWLVVVQWLSAAFGGYLAGRLRTKWAGIPDDETMFRDTAHGFLSWALATVVVAGLLGSAVTAVVGGGAAAVTSVASGAAQGAAAKASESAVSPDYYADMFFRPADNAPAGGAAPAAPAGDPAAARAEAGRILGASLVNGEVSAPDKAQLARLVAERTGLPAAEAQKRVDDVLSQVEAAKAKVKAAADTARKAAARFSLLTFLSLLIGAFIASVAAAIGGRQREAF